MNKLWLARNLAGRRAAMGSNPAAWRWGKEMLRPAYDRSPQFLQRFASNLVNTGNLEKGIMTTGTAALGLANQEEEGPLRAYGRPAAQFGGGILGTALGGATGFFADTPFSPVADFTLGAAGGAAGWETGGRLFDKLVPPKGVNNSNAINTGMANIPVGTKEAELEMRQQQGGYIPPGMTTSAGVPVEAQAGGPELDPWGRTKTYEAADGSMVNRSNVFTPHYETGEDLGVMTRNQRKAYDLAAAKAGF